MILFFERWGAKCVLDGRAVTLLVPIDVAHSKHNLQGILAAARNYREEIRSVPIERLEDPSEECETPGMPEKSGQSEGMNRPALDFQSDASMQVRGEPYDVVRL